MVARRRKTPDELLREVQAEESSSRRGYLKIVLGYASGVGKSFRMLDEARRRRERGQDVVVGAVQSQVSRDVAVVLEKLEVIPLKKVDGGETIDVDTILSRAPTVCFVDGLAYDNPRGSRNPTRWQDVQELLNAGIKVVASINIQYVSELSEQVEKITAKHVNQTVPVAFIKSADEIEMVDSPAEVATSSQQRLSKLRELALVLAADVVDQQLENYLEQYGIKQHLGAHERILVCVTLRTNVRAMIETAQIIAKRFHAELIAAYVNQPDISPSDRAALDERLEIAKSAGACIEILHGEDPVSAILDFAREKGITQLFIGHSQRSGMAARWMGNPVDRLIQRSRGMDVRIFPQ